MALQLDLGNLIGHLKLDDAQFNRGINSGVSGVKRLTATMRTMGHSAQASFRLAEKGVNLFLKPLTIGIKAMVAMKAATLATAAASVTAAAKYESFGQQLFTITKAKKAADEAFAESIEFSVRTPFTPEEIVATRVALESVGVKGAAAVKSVAEGAAAMRRNILDVATAVKSMEVEPIRNLGIMMDEIYRRGAIRGVTDDFRNSTKTFREAQKILLEIFEERFGGGIERMSRTFFGLTSTLRGAVTDLRATFGAGFLAPVKLGIQDMIDMIAGLKPAAAEAGVAFGKEVLKARNNMMAAFDVAMGLARQIKKATAQGGLGEIIVRAFQEGTGLVWSGIVEAFKVSLQLWKVIGSVIGEGLLNALYRSNLPLADTARKMAIRKRLSSMDASELRKFAKEQNIAIQPIISHWKARVGNLEVTKSHAATAKELVDQITAEIQKMPLEMQVAFAEADIGQTVEDGITEANEHIAASFNKLKTQASDALQNLANVVAERAGEEPINILEMFRTSVKKYEATAAEVFKFWQNLLEGDKQAAEEAARAAKAQADAMADVSTQNVEAASQVERQLALMERDLQLLDATNEERERQLALTDFQIQANEAYGASTERAAEAMAKYRQILDDLTQGERGFPRFTREIKQWVSDSSNVWAEFGKAATGALDRASDSLAEFLIKGKADFKAFAAAVLSETVRIMVRMQMANAISSVMGWKLFPSAASAPAGTPATGMPGAPGMTGPTVTAALGRMFSNGRLIPMLMGGIIPAPALIPMRGNNTALVAEERPEAVMQLGRDSQGRLGVFGNQPQTTVNTKIVNVYDREEALAAMNTSKGEKLILNVLRRNGVI